MQNNTNEGFVPPNLDSTNHVSAFQDLNIQCSDGSQNLQLSQFDQNSTTNSIIHNPIPLQFLPVNYGTAPQFMHDYTNQQQINPYDLSKTQLFQQQNLHQPITTNGIQLLEIPQFVTADQHQTAFQMASSALESNQISNIPSTQQFELLNQAPSQPFFYTTNSTGINAIDATNVIHEFLPQMAVFLPNNSQSQNNSNSQLQPSTSQQQVPNSKTINTRSSNSQSNKPQKTNARSAINNGEETSPPPAKKKFISPFAPEATVPLPSQLDELGNMGTTVWRRNERERYRVRCVNDGYLKLRNHLPLTEYEKRLSKVDTLRLSILYIRHLELLCHNIRHELECTCFINFTADTSGSN